MSNSMVQKDAAESLLLSGARLVLRDRVTDTAELIIKDGLILSIVEEPESRALSSLDTIDVAGLTIYPGFIDFHIHGSVGFDTMEATAEDLHNVGRFLARAGVTAWLPTLVPGSEEEYRRANQSIGSLMTEQQNLPPAARALGVHYEGPFVNVQQCGALRTQFFKTYSGPTQLERLPVPGPDAIRITTLAPEIEGGLELIRDLVKQGWIVSVGHTRADISVLQQARLAGARHVTHFFNAMPSLHHRTPGPVAWGLSQDDVTVDLIADGIHVHPLVLQLALHHKTPGRVSLISDAVSPAGLGDGKYRIWGEEISVTQGRTMNERGSIAGSVITMLDAVRLIRSLGTDPVAVGWLASLNAARLLGIEAHYGSIEEGKRADLVALDKDGNVRLTIVGGRVAFDGLKDSPGL